MLSIQHLYFSYQGQPPYVLNDLNVEVHSGDYISIVGDNGSGKSTLLRLILGFLTPVKGSITCNTNNIRYVSQKNDFSHAGFPITVHEILDSYRKLLNIKDKHEVNRVLELTHMTEFKDRLISKLSGGQAQRVSIARALIGNPDLIILDEPSTGIDRKSQEGIYALLFSLNQEHHITI
ncbi:MAG: ATP-binding cassette domain-containing protein, partial [Veillonella sp.]